MFTTILQTLRAAREPLGLPELAIQLGIEASALEGMLEHLVRQGKLRKSEEMTVEKCEREHQSGMYGNLCAFLTYGDTATRYEIVES